MKKKICFEADKLGELLPNYQFKRFGVDVEAEDGSYGVAQYYFCLPSVKAIKVSDGMFWTTMHIDLEDGTKISAKSENVNTDDMSIIRINNNDYVSPKLNCDGEFIELTEKLVNWLLKHGVTEDDLTKISKAFNIYEDIEYCGVPTPEYRFGSWAYSSNPLVLKEQEIETVLAGIENALLREKIKCILYAQVFKRR